jgi:hypothetical protein
MGHLAPGRRQSQELFLDPASLEEAGAHGMAGGAQIWPLGFKGGKLWGTVPHNFRPFLAPNAHRKPPLWTTRVLRLARSGDPPIS